MRADAAAIFAAALRAVDPTRLVAATLVRRGTTVVVDRPHQPGLEWAAPTLVIGAGKAAARMASGCEAALGVDNVRGEVIVADGCGVDLAAVRLAEAGHPLPDVRGVAATRRLVACLQGTTAGGIVCLISGGASSLLVSPRAPLTLGEKVRVTQLLLDCGASITELNTVRKHLSTVKGGGLLSHFHRPAVTLLLSDVVGDDPGVIGSGPTAADPTTFADATAVLARYGLLDRVPGNVTQLLREGVAGTIAETIKPHSPEADRSRNVIVGSNDTALAGAAAAARRRGWRVHVHTEPLVGDTTVTARAFGAWVATVTSAQRGQAPLCLLAGGETTVRVQGAGRGGRNQEFALALAPTIAERQVVVLSAGTDGVDGPTDAAGAFVDGATLTRARQRNTDADVALAANDSYGFFRELGDLFRCGPTGTNVMDIKIVLVPAPHSGWLPGSAWGPMVQAQP